VNFFFCDLAHGYGILFSNVFTTTCKERKNDDLYKDDACISVLRWKRQLSETRTMSALHAGCVERKTHGVWSATYVTMIFVRNASATAYGEKEREKWREYVLSFDEQEM
jgi:hypothetical protein